MPIYIWKDKKTGKEIQVIRSVSNIDTPPTREETGLYAEWYRIMCIPAKFVRGTNWNYRKGGTN